jgi:hypothetical protein
MAEKFERRPSLAQLPAQTQDSSARSRRAELVQTVPATAEELAALAFDVGSLEDDARKVESYATATFVIEQFWLFLKEETQAEKTRSQLEEQVWEGETRAERFTLALNTVLDGLQKQYFRDLQAKVGGQDEQLSTTDALMVRYFALQKAEGKGPGFPSMKDLVTLVGRMAVVIPKVYERDLRRAPTETELIQSLKHRSLKRFFMEIMTNSKEVSLPLFALLEGEDRPNLDDYHRAFDPKYFVSVEQEDGARVVQIDPEIVSSYRALITRVAEKRASEGKVPPRALQCPALYTGYFVEMHDWVVDAFDRFEA